MGYSQDTTWNVTVPFANLDTLFQGLVEYNTDAELRAALPDAVTELARPFGSHHDVEYRLLDDDGDDPDALPKTIRIIGWTAGSISDDDHEHIERLRNAKASGTIDGESEDGLHWRLRFHGDGRMTEHAGEIVYADDF